MATHKAIYPYYNDGLRRDAGGCLASGAAFLMGLSGSLVALLDTI